VVGFTVLVVVENTTSCYCKVCY